MHSLSCEVDFWLIIINNRKQSEGIFAIILKINLDVLTEDFNALENCLEVRMFN